MAPENLDVLIVTPNPEEIAPLLDGFRLNRCMTEPLSIGRLDCTLVHPLGMLVAPGGHGKTQLGVQTQYVISRFPGLEKVLCVGAAGCLSQNLAVGDVVVGTCTVEHDYKPRFNPRPSPRHAVDEMLLQRLRQVSTEKDFRFQVHFGPIASGDEDIVDRVRAAELREETGALCVAWEGSGAARAAAFNHLRFGELRVITDGANPDTPTDYYANLRRVMPHIAQLIEAAFC